MSVPAKTQAPQMTYCASPFNTGVGPRIEQRLGLHRQLVCVEACAIAQVMLNLAAKLETTYSAGLRRTDDVPVDASD
jgi:hypothetical protein